jgi:hypothetical protein
MLGSSQAKSNSSDNDFGIFARGTIIGAQITARFLWFYPGHNINGLAHLEQGGRRLSTNLKSRSMARTANALIDELASQFHLRRLTPPAGSAKAGTKLARISHALGATRPLLFH